MVRLLLISVVTLTLAIAPVAAALAADLGVITGSEKGTYYQFGLNLQVLTKTNGINMSVYRSKGSVENIYAGYQKLGVQLGIVQWDLPHGPIALQGIGGHAPRNGPDRYRRSAGRAEGRTNRRDVLRRRLSRPTPHRGRCRIG